LPLSDVEPGVCAGALQTAFRGQAGQRAGDRSDALDHGRPRRLDLALFKGDRGQVGEGCEQLAGTEQKIGVVRASKPLVALGEGFVNHNAARRQRSCDRRQQRATEIIGHDDPVVAIAERPRRAGLEIGLDDLAAWAGKYPQCRDIAVDSAHCETALA
jgi:hypothetical protein